MSTTRTPAATEREWFESWFDSEHYHRLYAHRTDEEAAGFVDRLVDRLRPAQGAAVLDLGCGAGRHSRRLATKRLDVTGLDLAAASIARAQAGESDTLRFRRHDMRLAFGTGVFDYVFSLFTSFGYFDDPAEDMSVLFNVATSLKRAGMFVLDYLNVLHAGLNLTAEETVVRDGVVYRLTRSADAYRFHKRIAIDVRDGSAARVRRTGRETLDRRLPVHVRPVRHAHHGGVRRLRPLAVRRDHLAAVDPDRQEVGRRGRG